MPSAPVLIVGAGSMGGAIIKGWLAAGSYSPCDLIIVDPVPSEATLALAACGARVNPDTDGIAAANTVLLAIKPQKWREAAAALAGNISSNAIIVSILAGIPAGDIARAFPNRRVARVMPTTAAAIRKATTSVFAADAVARERAHELFDSLGAVIDLPDEDMMHAATAACGSAPAYLYAFVEALQSAAVSIGIAPEAAAAMARSTITGAAALLDSTGADPGELRRQVTSPGGTTEAALSVLVGGGALDALLEKAVAAACARSRELAN